MSDSFRELVEIGEVFLGQTTEFFTQLLKEGSTFCSSIVEVKQVSVLVTSKIRHLLGGGSLCNSTNKFLEILS